MKKKYIIPIVSVIFVAGVASAYYFWWLPQSKARDVKIVTNPHDCAVTFDYYWCEAKQRCVRKTQEDCLIADGVKAALALKYQQPIEKIIIEIKKESAQFAEGRVWIDKQDGEGNRWMAAKPQDKWEIVYDGQAPINCAKITKAYELPPSVLQGFCD
jgi:hypothetical protein